MSLTPALIHEAAAWVARLHGPLRSPAVERSVRRWLEQSPEHRRAFELVTASWDEVGALRGGAHIEVILPSEKLRPVSRRKRLLPLTAAAALVLAVALGVVSHLRATVVTHVGEQRMVRLEDGSRVSLNTQTRMVVQFDERRRHVYLESGEALFEVAKHADRPFVVSAGGREVVALGTAFLVRHDYRHLAVTLMEGSVAVSPATDAGQAEAAGEPIVLEPGERLSFGASSVAPARDRPQIEKLTAWRRGKISIDNLSLADAVMEMNRYSNLKLAVSSDAAAGLRVSGIFRAGDSLSFARAVADSYGLYVQEHAGRVVLAGEPAAAARSHSREAGNDN